MSDTNAAPSALQLAELEQALRSPAYVEVRRRIFRQLIESLIYEGLVAAEERSAGEGRVFRIAGTDERDRPVTYQCWGRRCLSFDRIRLERRPVQRIAATGSSEADSLSTFLLETRAQLDADTSRLHQFIVELEQTLLKDVLAQHRRRAFAEPAVLSSYDELESALIDGHPYHPSYKSRIGFDYLANAAFGPEFGQELRPLWLAAHRSLAHSACSRAFEAQAFLTAELGEETLLRFRAELQSRGLRPADFVLLPVHPWQWSRQVVASLFADLREQHLVVLGPSDDRYVAQQSIRTLSNRSRPERAYLKLSLSIVNTSTSRILAPHTVQNAPRISDWLAAVVARDAYLRDDRRLILLREVLGVAYQPQRPAPLSSAVYGILSCIWRESLHLHLEQGEEALPFNGLCHLDRDGRPLIEPWVASMGVEAWTTQLLEVAIPPIVHLLVAHGIALEAHAQNMILVHREGRPQRLALKDFHDGIRFAPAYLAEPELQPALCPTPATHVNANSYLEAQGAEEVRDFVHDAFFFINLAELAIFLDEHYGLAERCFWSLARQVIERYQRRFPELSRRVALFDLFAPTVQVEQLTKRRLHPDTQTHVHRVRNVLALLTHHQQEGSWHR